MIAFSIALVFYYGQSFKEAIYSEGFPVPASAQIQNISSTNLAENYTWKPVSEEHGLPMRYQLIILFSGWKKTDQMGALTTYEKNGVKVDVISHTQSLAILGPQ